MAGYTDIPFRRLCHEQGAAWAVTEMVLARGFLNDEPKAYVLGMPYQDEPNVVVQLFGHEPQVLQEAAHKAQEVFKPKAIDLNMGCPAPKMLGRGGACLLQTPEVAAGLVAAMKKGTTLEVSAKIRLGWSNNNAVYIAQALEGAGASLITVHGRTSQQRYTGQADWQAIHQVAQAVSIPVLGSGDVVSPQDIAQRSQLAVAGIMVGRGAVGNPWIFSGSTPTPQERIDTALRHCNYNIEHYGHVRGMMHMRKVLPKYFPQHNQAHAALKLIEYPDELLGILGLLE